MLNLDDDYAIDDDMQLTRKLAINKIKRTVSSAHVEEFAAILLYAWQESLPEADTLVDVIDLSQIEFMAIANNRDEYISLLKDRRYA